MHVDGRAPKEVFDSKADLLRNIASEFRVPPRRRRSARCVELAIVGAPPRGIAQGLVGAIKRLNAQRRIAPVRVYIRVVEFRELPVSIADLRTSAAAVETERLVVVRLRSATSHL